MIDRYNNYAPFYDQGTNTDIVAKVDLIRQTINRLNPSAKSLLEIACGTGNVLAQLQGSFELSGLDLSTKMLEIAKAKLVGVELYEDDTTSFNLDKKFDVIICVFDSLNHLLTFQQWEQFFDRTKEHLNDNGLFIMDVNTISKLDKLSSLSAFRLDLKNGYQIARVAKEPNGIYHWLMDVYVTNNNAIPEVIKNDIPETAFSLQQTEEALRQRFVAVERFTPDATVADELADRIYFACTV